MNIYRVISEELSVVVPVLDTGEGPREYGCIAEIVAAPDEDVSRRLAWETDVGPMSFKTYQRGDEMPRFDVVRCLEGVDVPAGIYSRDDRFSSFWDLEP